MPYFPNLEYFPSVFDDLGGNLFQKRFPLMKSSGKEKA